MMRAYGNRHISGGISTFSEHFDEILRLSPSAGAQITMLECKLKGRARNWVTEKNSDHLPMYIEYSWK